ncbi:hypothetical protein ACOMHN_006982 [Nucella lapillus]
MEGSMSRASAYQKRNKTTHSWYGDWSSAGCIMSQSLPSARTLEEHMRNARKAMSVTSSFYQPRRPGSSSAEASHSTTPVVHAKSVAVPKTLGNGAFTPSYVVKRGSGTVPSSSASSPGPTTAVKFPHADLHAHLDPINGGPSNSYSYDGGFFVTANNANKDFFVIDPEWVSEVGTIKKHPPGKTAAATPDKPVVTKPPRNPRNYKRSKSAPPAKHRQNPIMWQY